MELLKTLVDSDLRCEVGVRELVHLKSCTLYMLGILVKVIMWILKFVGAIFIHLVPYSDIVMMVVAS